MGYEEWRPCPTDVLCSGTFTGEGLTDIVVAKDGMLWYTNEVKRTIGRFDPGSKAYAEYSLTSMDPTLAQGDPEGGRGRQRRHASGSRSGASRLPGPTRS